MKNSYGLIIIVALLGACTTTTPKTTNPLLAEWTGPYGGVPPFDQVRVSDFKPALEAGMAEALKEVDRIANNPAPPAFENTIVEIGTTG